MLDCLPIYHWFHCGNPYSGAQGGMRYLVAPAKKADPADESGKRKIEYLTATIWPGPWSLEHTADEKQEMAEFPGNQEGLDAAVAVQQVGHLCARHAQHRRGVGGGLPLLLELVHQG